MRRDEGGLSDEGLLIGSHVIKIRKGRNGNYE